MAGGGGGGWRWSALALVVLLTGGCAPAVVCELCASQRLVPGSYRQLFFSSEAWGGLPFSAAEKRELLVRAVRAKNRQRIERTVPFVVDGAAARVLSFVALYEVDARGRYPSVRAGYVVEVDLGAAPLRLTNAVTGRTLTIDLSAEPVPPAGGTASEGPSPSGAAS